VDLFANIQSGGKAAAETFGKSIASTVASIASQLAIFFASTGMGKLLLGDPTGAIMVGISVALAGVAAALKSLAGGQSASPSTQPSSRTPTATAPNPATSALTEQQGKQMTVVFVNEEPWTGATPEERFRRFERWQRRFKRQYGGI